MINVHSQGYVLMDTTYPLVDYRLRTDESFAEQHDEEHHHEGPNPFHGLGFGMVSGFPLDYMHLVCLGVVRKLLVIWLRGPLQFRLPAIIVNKISDRLIQMRPHIPVEFARKPRSLREIDRWKATEFREFLFYTGPVVLASFINPNIYNNFMLLFSGIPILVSPTHHFTTNMQTHCLEHLCTILVNFMVKTSLSAMYMVRFISPRM